MSLVLRSRPHLSGESTYQRADHGVRVEVLKLLEAYRPPSNKEKTYLIYMALK
jgi:hypothetical protein